MRALYEFLIKLQGRFKEPCEILARTEENRLMLRVEWHDGHSFEYRFTATVLWGAPFTLDVKFSDAFIIEAEMDRTRTKLGQGEPGMKL